MPQSYLIFDFATNEEAARLARHKIENWKQAFRLGAKLDLRFQRTPTDSTADPSSTTAPKDVGAGLAPPSPGKNTTAPGKGTPTKGKSTKSASEESSKLDPDAQLAPPDKIRLLVRLDFSDHEKLSLQRWLDRIPTEDPFKSASPQLVRPSDLAHADTRSLFESI